VVQRVEQHPHARRDRLLRRDPAPLARLGGECGEQPAEVGAFVAVQTQDLGDGVDDPGRRSGRLAALQPHVVLGADPGQ